MRALSVLFAATLALCAATASPVSETARSQAAFDALNRAMVSGRVDHVRIGGVPIQSALEAEIAEATLENNYDVLCILKKGGPHFDGLTKSLAATRIHGAATHPVFWRWSLIFFDRHERRIAVIHSGEIDAPFTDGFVFGRIGGREAVMLDRALVAWLRDLPLSVCRQVRP